MPMLNRMTDLLNLIEHRLGTKQLNLPESLGKDVWADQVIEKETLTAFSRFIPHMIPYYLTDDRKKGNVYLIDEKLCNSVEILGCGDILWNELSKTSPGWGYGTASYFSMFDFFSNSISMDDIGMYQMLNDHTSMLKCSIYLQFVPPNMIRLESALSNNMTQYLKAIPIQLFVKHSKNLMTIPPTQMEVFEQLACCDVAIFLYHQLKYYQNVESAFATTDLNLDVLQDMSNRRDDVCEILRSAGTISAANRFQPMIIAI